MQVHDKPLEVQVVIKRNGYLDAICTTFHLSLVKNNPLQYVLHSDISSNTCWEQAIYPVRTFNCSKSQVLDNRIKVAEGDTVSLKFTQNHDKISLISLEIRSQNRSNQAEYEQTLQGWNECSCLKVVLNEGIISYINDSLFWKIFCESFASWYQKVHGHGHLNENPVKVLIMSKSFSPLCIFIAKSFPNILVCHYSPNEDVGNSMKAITKHLDIHNFDTLSHPCEVTDCHALLFNPVEAESGCLDGTLLQSLAHTRLLTKQRSTIFPVSVDVMILLIECEELMKQCSVVSDSSTMGIKIGEFLNKFQVTTFSHFKLDQLCYKAFSEPKYVFTLKFDSNYHAEKTICKNIIINPTNTGTAHAAVLWFIMKVDETSHFDTSDPSNSFHQSARVFPQGQDLTVVEGRCIELSVSCRGSYITVRSP